MLAFTSAPDLKSLTSPVRTTRRTVLQKVRSPSYKEVPQLVDTGFQVLFHSPPGVLFTFPSQYYALSVTKKYLALRGGPRSFRQGFSCLVLLWILLGGLGFRIRGFHSLRPDFPVRSPILRLPCCSPNPAMHASRFGLLPFRSPLLWKSIFFFLFLRVLRCFSSPGSPHAAMDSLHADRGFLCRVSPFRYLRIIGYMLLPEAFRSLSRLSSALSAKASTLRPYYFNRSRNDRIT